MTHEEVCRLVATKKAGVVIGKATVYFTTCSNRGCHETFWATRSQGGNPKNPARGRYHSRECFDINEKQLRKARNHRYWEKHGKAK